ncbi:MAG: hypothetical protein ACFE9S_19910 [Candidatus Hermodarchaeota archaeon]
MNVWTACLYNNHFPNINLNKETQILFLHIHYWNHLADWAKGLGGYGVTLANYYSKYREIDFGNTFLAHNYDGSLPITITINPGKKFEGELFLDGSVFKLPSLTSDIVSVKIIDVRGGECGSYEDYYTDQGHSEGSAHLTVLDPTISGVSQKIVNWLNSYDLGWQRSEEVSHDPGAVIQQSIRDESWKGQTFIDDSTSKSTQFFLPVHIPPEVKKSREYIDFTKGAFRYFLCCGDIDLASVEEFRIERDISVHVYNQFVHYDLEVETDLFLTVQFEGKISESFLNDPNLHISDMLWDTSILGTYMVDIGLTKEQDIFSTIIIIIVLVLLLVVAYILYKRYKRKRITGANITIVNKGVKS